MSTAFPKGPFRLLDLDKAIEGILYSTCGATYKLPRASVLEHPRHYRSAHGATGRAEYTPEIPRGCRAGW